MEDFGTLSIRLHTSVPRDGKYFGKSVVLHRIHGRLDECKQQYADWLAANRELKYLLGASWEVRMAVHQDDLPPAR